MRNTKGGVTSMTNIKVYNRFLNYCIENNLDSLITPVIDRGRLSISYVSALELSVRTNIHVTLPEKGVCLLSIVVGDHFFKKAMSYTKKDYEEQYVYGVILLLASVK